MTFRKLLFLAVSLSFSITSGSPAADRLPGISQKMETPGFWIKKIKKPDYLLLKPEEIEKMNEENLNRQDLYLWRVKDLKDEWTREELLEQLKEDWEGFEKTRNGNSFQELFWTEVKTNLNHEGLGEKNRVLFALVVKRTDIRYFPTDEVCANTLSDDRVDRIQHSTVAPGSLVGIHHFSKDGRWAYVQTRFVRGWIHASDLAIAKDRNEAVGYEQATDRLVVTGNSVNVFDDPAFRQPLLSAQMGTSFPMFGLNRYYVVKIPSREMNGKLVFRNGYIAGDADVCRGFLSYTQKNLAIQAFKMLHQPYAWGEKSGGRDCSRFIMDLFATFGIVMPRNSLFQAKVGIALPGIERKTLREKERSLDQAIPLATTIRLPGHIMLYLGKNGGKYYVIHSILGISKKGNSGPVIQRIGRVVVSDLNLGEPNRSLLHRSTDIQVIGSPSEARKRFLKKPRNL